MKKTLLLFILCMVSLQKHIVRPVIFGADGTLTLYPFNLAKEDFEFIILAQRTYCVITHDCQSVFTPITDVNKTLLETRLSHQIDIQPVDCCEQCECDHVCCCSSDKKPDSDRNNKLLSCVHPQLKPWNLKVNSYPHSRETYLMSTSISNPNTIGTSESLKIDTENEIFTPPVFDSNNNITYENRLIAQLNNRSTDFLIPWDSSLECKDGTFITQTSGNFIEELRNNTNCNLIFYPPENIMKSKCVPLIDRCNVTGKWARFDSVIDRACNLYTAPYAVSYKNVFCYICNKEKEIASPIEKCIPEQENPSRWKNSLRMLLRSDIDVSDDEKVLSKDGREQPIYCIGKTLYDSLQKSCVTAICIPPNVFLKGGCVNVAKRIGGILYRMFLVLVPRFKMENIISEVDKIDAYITTWLDSMHLLDSLGILSIHKNKQSSNERFLVVHIDLHIGKEYGQLVETEKIEKLTGIKNINIDSSDSTICASKSYFVYFDKYEISYNSRLYNITLREENENGTVSLQRIKERSLYNSYPNVYVMVLYPASFCPLMALNDSFYNISILSFSIFVGRFNVKLNQSEFIIHDDGLHKGGKNVFICLDTFIRLKESGVTISNDGATSYQTFVVALNSVFTIFTFLS